MARGATAAIGYLAAMTAYVYGIANPGVGYGSDAFAVAVLAALVAVHFGTGVAGGRWWLVPLPAIVVVLALPAGYPSTEQGEPLPIWWSIAVLVAVPGALLIALGVALGRRMIGKGEKTASSHA